MKKNLLSVVTALSFLLFSGCAMIISGENQNMTIHSDPEDAEVLLNGQPIGHTPLVTQIKKGKNKVLSVRKDGYKQVDIPMYTSFDAVALLGVFTYSLPLTTDVVSGTAYEFSPNYYQFQLKKAKTDTKVEKTITTEQVTE